MLDVYVDRRASFVRRGDYVLHRMLDGLRRAGIDWRVLDQGGPGDSGAVAFVHVDLTDVPEDILRCGRRYAETINGNAATIDRRVYSSLRVSAGDQYDGPVIAKTVRNSRGYPELRYAASRTLLTKVKHVARRLTIPGYKARQCPAYRIYGSLAEVPAETWTDERLIVERFAPGALTTPLTRYKYNFFLDIEQNTRSTFTSLIYDDSTVEAFEVVDEVHDEARRVRQVLQLDYGAIEYFVVDDACFVIDANKTVTQPQAWIARFPQSGRYIEAITDRLVALVKAGGA